MNILGTRKIWLTVSGLLVLASIVAMITYGFKPGIDFAGGSLLEMRIENVEQAKLPADTSLEAYIIQSFKASAGQDVIVQREGENQFLLRTKAITNEQKNIWLSSVNDVLPQVTELRFESVSPTIGAEVVRKAAVAVILAVLAILLYLAYAFRRVPRPTSSWQFGMAAIAALAHDVTILLGAYAVLGHFLGAEADSMFITALLTLLGFSVHDTIVTFDRLRENLLRRGGADFERKMNDSIIETVTRSINTSFTVALVLGAMVLMGGGSIFFFTLALLIGIVVGTYSSIFVASPLLLWWHNLSNK
ncbi:TPA: protein translocase subunit SecF [Patescibacteria group bacterium]|uniref:Protein-export membrane protein SecF n=2 Tax=Bacteria division Kazan-3B-28 TaxID=1798534 RepID=A0A0G1ZG99_UNCK3|nr:MAG: protein-export membrane protein SecF, preprotein translocase subunit SecF [candidate division Kazan bacterium GW2011_GWA1_50_15]KKW25622.1 MAG: Protein translocase subunit SecF [candidate division Kazan bacterium GW2011_GWC1_52_13]KKW26927.1 MAG: Protein translocase subunit SecF [candidate division Kazan bacterium GW2011_GWB1_52_7]HAV66084.1 protein translocase subunit SecF [Patescibacteria group bacterium]HCL47615.1 protein translocase subunit SecF [Patescibacteria group bacterium]